MGQVRINGAVATKAGIAVRAQDHIRLVVEEQYVSRAGHKLASVAKLLGISFQDAVVLDVGSSTGGFTDYALKRGARKVIAVDVGTNQLHQSLRGDVRIELHEKTDIRDTALSGDQGGRGTTTEDVIYISEVPDVVVIDVSFISLRQILPHIVRLSAAGTIIVAMVKPQFEAEHSNLKHKGVIKNDRMRRDILKDFEDWSRELFVIRDKADSDVAGSRGNVERFYALQLPR
jgi:23S rRNA (cytidine1920-2'-O)/16S rRNA (cytidine1409-2'-O)-methyltransferase